MRGPSGAGRAGPGRQGGTGEGRAAAADLQHRKSHPHRPPRSADVNQPLKVALRGERGAERRAGPGGAPGGGGTDPTAAAAPADRADRSCPPYRGKKTQTTLLLELYNNGSLTLFSQFALQQRSRACLQNLGTASAAAPAERGRAAREGPSEPGMQAQGLQHIQNRAGWTQIVHC